MRKWWLIFVWLLIFISINIFQPSTTVIAQEYTESPHVFMIEAERCLHESDSVAEGEQPIRKQTGFRIKGIAGIITALHGIVDCETIIAVSESKAGEAFGELEIAEVDIDRDVVRLLPRGITDVEAEVLAQLGFEVASDDDTNAYAGLYLIGHPYGARAQYTTEQIELRKTSTDTLALLLSASLTAKLRQRNSPNPDLDVLSIEGHLVPGHSGAPILNSKDQVVGIGNGGLGDEISWLIPWRKIQWQKYDDVWSRIRNLKSQNPADIFFDVVEPLSTSTEYVVYSGRVFDEQGNLIDRARVILDLDGESHIVYTDSEGKFEVIAEAKQSARGRIYIQAEGYSPLNRLIDLLVAQRGGEEFALRSTGSGTLRCPFAFRIIDTDLNPIRGVHVKLLYHLEFIEDFTNSDGEYRGEFPCETANPLVNVEVTAQGFASVEKSVILYPSLIRIQLLNSLAATVIPTFTSTLLPLALTSTFTPIPQPAATTALPISTFTPDASSTPIPVPIPQPTATATPTITMTASAVKPTPTKVDIQVKDQGAVNTLILASLPDLDQE